jgi:hypothetical protein
MTENERIILEQAYNKTLKERIKKDNYEYAKENDFIAKYQEYMLNWDGKSDLHPEFTLINETKLISALGSSYSSKGKFEDLLKEDSFKEKWFEIVNLRKEFKENQYKPFIIAAKIQNTEYEKLISRLCSGPSPKPFVNRMILCLFPEICTSVATVNNFRKVYEALELNYINDKASIIPLYEIREKTDKYLKEAGVYDKFNTFEKMVMGWFIADLN